MQIEQIEVKKIKRAKFNPKSRVFDERLKASLIKFGIIEPLILTEKYVLVNGHRRLGVAKFLKWETVPAIIKNGKTEALHDELFETLNTTNKNFNGAQQLQAWLLGAKISPQVQKAINYLLDIMGLSYLKRLAENNWNPVNYKNEGRRICKYVGSDKGMTKKIFEYIFEHGGWMTRKAVEDGISVAKLRKAIINNTPLKRDWN